MLIITSDQSSFLKNVHHYLLITASHLHHQLSSLEPLIESMKVAELVVEIGDKKDDCNDDADSNNDADDDDFLPMVPIVRSVLHIAHFIWNL